MMNFLFRLYHGFLIRIFLIQFRVIGQIRGGEAVRREARGLSGTSAGSAGAVMGRHALLSASSSKRWLNCTPSARLEGQFGREDAGSYAEEGTAAHALA